MKNNEKVEKLEQWLKVNNKLKFKLAKLTLLDEERKSLIELKEKEGLTKENEIRLLKNYEDYSKLFDEISKHLDESKKAEKDFKDYFKNAPTVLEEQKNIKKKSKD